ncbi:MAG: hypothetical protein KAS62_10925, partial [Candidatus Delongbacteria bacterium]|nr:hypothetical protein [Candidatus Delongbacteria bacterium]
KYSNKEYITHLTGYDYQLDYSNNYNSDSIYINNDIYAKMNKDSLLLVFSAGEKDITVDLKNDIKNIITKTEVVDRYNNFEREKMTTEKENDDIRYKIIFRSFNYTQEGTSTTNIRHPSFTMYFRLKKQPSD